METTSIEHKEQRHRCRYSVVLRCSPGCSSTPRCLTGNCVKLLTALFHKDGYFRKTIKADLIRALESKATSAQREYSAINHQADLHIYIRDGMAELQRMSGHHNTFGDLAQCYRSKQCLGRASTVADVFNRYDVDFIKGQEQRRAQAVTGASHQYSSIRTPVPVASLHGRNL